MKIVLQPILKEKRLELQLKIEVLYYPQDILQMQHIGLTLKKEVLLQVLFMLMSYHLGQKHLMIHELLISI